MYHGEKHKEVLSDYISPPLTNNMRTTMTSHPLIPNANQYVMEQKYISIHSNDRDALKYPSSSEFEIFLPQEYLNVASARLYSWSFPANYNVFSVLQYNLNMTFKFSALYNPAATEVEVDPLLEGIYAALLYHGDKDVLVVIEPGFYNPSQMTTELQNKFNNAVSNLIVAFFDTPSEWGGHDYSVAKSLFKMYDRFKIVYNSVSQTLWFGNTADNFVLTNGSDLVLKREIVDSNCLRRNMLPEWANWGLPYYLGFSRCDAHGTNSEDFVKEHPREAAMYFSLFNGEQLVPRFFYGDAETGTGDGGFWLVPTLPDATVYFVQAPFKISFMGPAYIYMEIDGMNCIDETTPFNVNRFTSTHNVTNSVVNSSFAKIPIPTTPISQWFDSDMMPYKYWTPPAERISKLKIKLRYHNGMLVEFGQFEFSFMLEFNLLKPQPERSYNIVNAYDLGQQQSSKSRFSG